jgi:hypothetical protein
LKLVSRAARHPDKPLAFWWWLNCHTDEASITSDLEAVC